MKNKVLWLHSLFINPCLNLLAIYYTNIFERSQTYVGNTLHHPIYLIMWTLSSCFGYYVYSKKIWDTYCISYNKYLHSFVNIGILISVFLPCSNQLPGLINDFHIWIAAFCIAGFIIEWIYYALNSYLQYEKEYKVLFVLFGICTFTLMLFGHVTAFSEILFSTSINAYLFTWAQKKEA